MQDIKLNKTTESFSISMPTWLVEELDHICEEIESNRSSFICSAVRKHILAQLDTLKLWDELYQRRRKSLVRE